MGPKECDYDGGIDEDQRIRNDDERRPLDVSAIEALATLLSTSESVANFEQKAGDDWEECSRIS